MKINAQSWHFKFLYKLYDHIDFGWGYLNPYGARDFCSYARKLVLGVPAFFLGWAVLIIPVGIAVGIVKLYEKLYKDYYKSWQYRRLIKQFEGLEGPIVSREEADDWLKYGGKVEPYAGYWLIVWGIYSSRSTLKHVQG
jgi:hypothetical protein